jgi:hypothetical protein
MVDQTKIEQVKAEASGRRLAELVAEDVHQLLMLDLQYADMIKNLAVATLAGLQREMQVMGDSGGSTR